MKYSRLLLGFVFYFSTLTNILLSYSESRIYVALQALDQVAIYNLESNTMDRVNINYDVNCMSFTSETACSMAVECEWMVNHCMEKEDVCMGANEDVCNATMGCSWMMNMCMSGGMMGNHTPHFITVDKVNRYWFVTTITSGFVGRYDLDKNILIDKIMIGDSPALMTINENDKKLYISRMMPMSGMMTGSVSTIIQEIDYSDSTTMVAINEYAINSPAPHALSINKAGNEIYTASNTADWLYKISPDSNRIDGVVMDLEQGNYPDNEVKRLKPIQCLSVEPNLLFVTCSAGKAYNSFTGKNDTIPGQVQLWNSTTMSLIDTAQFSWKSTPWHIVHSPIEERVFVVLSGDNIYAGTAGVVCLSYNGNKLDIIWSKFSEKFNILHGIDISSDGKTLYVTGRGDGYLHSFDTEKGEHLASIPLWDQMGMAMAGGVAFVDIKYGCIDSLACNYDPKAIIDNGNCSYSEQEGYACDGLLINKLVVPNKTGINRIFPNPFNPLAIIDYNLQTYTFVELKVYDLKGCLVTNLVEGYQYKGNHSFIWDAGNLSGGIYMVQLATNYKEEMYKISLIK